jgi:hypothetical protein
MAELEQLRQIFDSSSGNPNPILDFGDIETSCAREGSKSSFHIRAVFSKTICDSCKLENDPLFKNLIQTSLQTLASKISSAYENTLENEKIYLVYNYSINAGFKSEINLVSSNSSPLSNNLEILNIADEILAQAKACDSKIDDYFANDHKEKLKKAKKIEDLYENGLSTLRKNYLYFQESLNLNPQDTREILFCTFFNMIIRMPEVEESLVEAITVKKGKNIKIQEAILKLIRKAKAKAFLNYKQNSQTSSIEIKKQKDQLFDSNMQIQIPSELTELLKNYSSINSFDAFFQTLVDELNLSNLISNNNSTPYYFCSTKIPNATQPIFTINNQKPHALFLWDPLLNHYLEINSKSTTGIKLVGKDSQESKNIQTAILKKNELSKFFEQRLQQHIKHLDKPISTKSHASEQNEKAQKNKEKLEKALKKLFTLKSSKDDAFINHYTKAKNIFEEMGLQDENLLSLVSVSDYSQIKKELDFSVFKKL